MYQKNKIKHLKSTSKFQTPLNNHHFSLNKVLAATKSTINPSSIDHLLRSLRPVCATRSFFGVKLKKLRIRMEHLLGLLRIRVHRGVNLAIRDVRSSDPYLMIRMGKQKLKTRVVWNNTNPVWDEDLTLTIADSNIPIKLAVYDKDTFSPDDKMGDAEFDINPFLEAIKMRLDELPNNTIITTVKPNRSNCLAEESQVVWSEGKVVQNMVIRLQNVESGEVELQLQWIDVPGSRGL